VEYPLNTVIITVSDTRTEETDKSGRVLVEALTGAGHRLVDKQIIRDDTYKLRAAVAHWIAEDDVHAVLLTGGTGFTERDNTVRAVQPLLDIEIQGFGELFRHLSYQEIGHSTIQSRAFAGLANHTLVCCVPGSPGACRTAWNGIIAGQMDAGHKPCNFAEKVLKLRC